MDGSLRKGLLCCVGLLDLKRGSGEVTMAPPGLQLCLTARVSKQTETNRMMCACLLQFIWVACLFNRTPINPGAHLKPP